MEDHQATQQNASDTASHSAAKIIRSGDFVKQIVTRNLDVPFSGVLL